MNIFKNSIAVTFLLFAAGVAQADLLGISPTAPSFFVFPARALPNASYDAASDTLSVAASVPGLRLADNSIIIIRGGTLQISVGIDGAGAAVLPGTSSDIVISGTVEINNITYSGVLLTGQLLSFGIADASQGNDTETDKIDFLFSKTGGQLSDFFGNFDIGVSGLDANGVGIGATLEASSYAGSFSSNWSASKFKADIGRIEPGCTGAIGDFVWQDTDGNGQQDGGEPGIGGVTVNITDFAGFNDFTVTAGDGSYSFTGLDCDVTYTVSVVNPDPNTYQPAPVDVGDDATDSDNHGGAPGTPTSAMPTDNTVDFGYVLIPASLGDFVWLDEDQDGLQGGNEPGLDDITVVLKDCQLNMITQTTTSNGGFYLFDDLDPGQYVVMVMKPDGSYSFTTMDVGANANDGTDSDVNPATGNTDCITLDPGEDERDVDAGLFQGAGLGNYVWEDLNADGIQNDGNTGIEGVTVELLDCAMSSFNPPVTTTTDVNGLYQFNDLAAGCYIVMFSQPAGFDSASPTGQGGFETDSDADPLTGKTGEINLADGQFDPTWDAGFYKTASLGDRVWSDLNRNGLQDENEVGINDCVVELLDENMASFQPKVLDVTANDGNYLFDNLEPGTYFVQFSNSCTDSWVYTLQNVDDPASDAIDSDANSTGKTAEYTLVSGDENLTVDAGLHVPAMPRISIEKDTNGFDADVPTGPFVPVSPPGDLFWTYVVKNDGNVDLIDVVVSDDKLPANGQPEFLEGDTNNNQILETTETWIYTASDLAGAMLGQYMNTGSVCSTDATGATPGGPGNICDDDPSHYFGADPQIDIEKLTNGNQADLPDDPDVPVIPIGGDVTWTYIVTNTGNVDLTNIAVTDNMLLDSAITCPADALQASDPDSFFECTASGIAEAGLYGNIAMVTGKGPEGAGDPAPDMDPSHYIGETMPSIVLEKATNGVDADAPGTGPFIAAGGDVTWTYVVTNTGDVDLENVMITDDEQGAICTIPLLAANGGMDTCTKMGTAQAGDYDNLGTACGTDATGATPGGPGNICDDDPSRYFGSMPTIVLEKATNGVDADAPGTGPFIAAGGDVTWTYVVTNTGNVDLENVMITDDEQGAICTIPLLAANGGMDTCTKMGTAQAGDYDNLGTACGTDATGATPGGPGNICDDDPSRYFGSMPTIVLEKATNGVDADAPGTGPFIAAGGDVTWTYVVTNTGNVDLENVMITDDEQGAICTIPLLAANGGMDTCTKMGTAQAGDYDNLGTACGTDATGATPGGPGNICDDDPSRYFGSMPTIVLEKATNGVDADAPGTGPFIAAGGDVTWTYVVTNTGNVDLENVMITDDEQGAICTIPLLAANGGMDTCTKMGTAQAGDYDNLGTACGTDATGATPGGPGNICDDDPSRYFGSMPTIVLEKATNGVDADAPGTGPFIAAGGDVTWTYVVTNTGNVDLENVMITDDEQGAICTIPLLAANGGMDTCTKMGTAQAGDYDNLGTACGTDATGATPGGPGNICDDDPSRYFGSMPTIVLEKATNGVDADAPGTGPFIAAGGDVTWTYVVTNTGNVDLENVMITDDEQGAICTIPLLAANGGMDTCTKMGTAQAGDYDNLGTACGTDATGATPGGPGNICDDDPSRYFGSMPTIVLEKATNGVDADAPGTGPFIATGGEVTWTYVVTNTGNVDLENVMITDDEQGAICTIPLLAANGGMDTCTKMGTAQAGDYDNLGTACGTDATGATPGGPGNICDDDPSRYFGSMPDIDIEKFTNNSAGDPRQADNPTGPGLLVGSTATFTYVVTNAGNEPIKNVVVTDDRGVVPSFVGGDTNMDGLLDLDETWTYTGSATVVMGQYANIGTVNGTGNGSNTPVSDTDPSHHIGLRPGIDIEKATNGEDADSAPGVLIPVGETATFTYVVSNPVGFNEGVRNVVVVDDNGTADAGDNFYPAPVLDGGFNVGDLDGDNVLDFNETWTYTASRTVIAGQYTNNSTVTGFGNNTNEPVGDADPSNHFGLAPAIQIEKATNGQDADIPTGPKISVGGAVLWTYVVTNTGNEPLTVVSVTDNQGVVPVFQGGDTNNDGYLDLDEAWEYEVGGTAEAGQYANVGRVFGIGRTSNIEVDDTDPSHYFGLAQCDLTLEKMCFVVPPPVTNSAFACDKPIDSLTMIWNGPGTVWVEAWKGPVGSTSLGEQSVSNGGEITFTGFAGSPNDVFWEVYSDAGLTNKLGESKFHLSCSDDDMDGPEDCGKLEGNGKDNGGSLINQWLLEGIVDAKNTLDCTVDTDPVYLENCEFVSEPGASCETEGDVESLTFRYVPSDCSTTNTQEGRYSCTGGTLSGDAVFSLTANQDDYTVNPSNGQVSPNDLITISGKFSSNFEFRLSGNTVQDYEVHTSCSKALAVGDVFGSFELVGFNGKTGGQEVMYEYTVTNNSTGAVSNIDVTDNKIPGVIGTIASLPAGATSDPVYAQAFLTATTTNIGTATGDLVGTDDCAATSEAVTVTALEPPRSCETDDKPTSLTFDVTGSCSDQDNFQDGKAKCTGPDLTGDVVSIVINKDADKIGATVDDGDTITVFQTDKIGERLQSTVKFTITDSNGDSQYHEVHTSCSQPLAEGDLLGGIELVEYVPASN